MFSALKTRLVPVLATTGVAAALLLGGSVAANADTGLSGTEFTVVDTASAQPATSVVTGPAASQAITAAGDVTAQGNSCRTHNPPGTGSATACRTWDSIGGGSFSGRWTWSGTSGVYVQGSFDGDVVNLANSGDYYGVKKFLTRGCKAGKCTGWS